MDGFGIGMVCCDQPVIYRNAIPPWNDLNLRKIVSIVKPCIVLVHIRAVASFANICKYSDKIKKTPVHEFNCHPFSHNEFIFCHNGIIEAFYDGTLRKKIINRISDELITNIDGTTDSEYLFYLMMTFIYENNKDIIRGITNTIEFLNTITDDTENMFCLNMCLIYGKEIYSMRYINIENDTPPSLYINGDSDEGSNEIVISSEPIDKNLPWRLIGKNKVVHIDSIGKIEEHTL